MYPTEAQLSVWLQLAEKATPGPWVLSRRFALNKDRDISKEDPAGLGWEVEGPPEPILRGQFKRGYDALFIAVSRDGWPLTIKALLDARAALRELLMCAPDIEGNVRGSSGLPGALGQGAWKQAADFARAALGEEV